MTEETIYPFGREAAVDPKELKNKQLNSADILPFKRSLIGKELCSNYLTIRSFHMPRLTRAEQRALKSVELFIIRGDMNESIHAQHNNEVLKRMLERLSRPDSPWRRMIMWLNEVVLP